MSVFGTLPTWAIVILAVLVAAILLLQNIGWLLAAKGLLDAQRRAGRAASHRLPDRPARDHAAPAAPMSGHAPQAVRVAASGASAGAEQDDGRRAPTASAKQIKLHPGASMAEGSRAR
jgi:hypothetical protein